MTEAARQRRGRHKPKAAERGGTHGRARTGDGADALGGLSGGSAGVVGAAYASGPALSLAGPVQARSGDEPSADAGASRTSPVQQKCASCDGDEERASESAAGADDDAVQLWDCSDYDEPTCVQAQEADEEGPVQPECEACAAEEAEAQDQPVQLWDCSDYPKPTCAIQTKAGAGDDSAETSDMPDGALGVQAKCAGCEDESEAAASGGDDVQTKASRSTGRSATRPGSRRKAAILQQAGEGLRDAHSPLPHRDRIQASFGHHDISDVRSETGGAAGRASERIGALAYASGNRIGFRSPPSLHLSAHEAAHSVQQRSGLKLPGNVGRPGDRWERHADRVADAVVAGESAEPLLSSVVPTPARPSSQSNPGPDGAATSAATGVHSAPANGDGIAPQVQGSITSGATHRVEPEQEAGDEAAGGGDGTAGPAESADGAAEGGEAEGEPSDAVEHAAEVSEEHEADPAADCEEAQGDDDGAEQQPAPQQGAGGEQGEQGESGQAAAGPPQKGQCYDVEAPDPPPGAEEPAQDAPPNESDAQAEVSYDEWEEPNDACECAAAEQVPANAVEQQVATAVPGELGTAAEATAGGGEAVSAGAGAGGGASAAGASGRAGGDTAETGSQGQLAQGEAGRDLAVTDFDAASTEVARVPDRARNLSKGLRFGGAPTGTAAEEAERASALGQIGAFLQGATAQMDGAVAFVRDEAPARLGAMAEAVKANIEASILAEKAAISARIRQAERAAVAAATAARNSINSDYAAAVASVDAETDAAIDALNDAHATATDAIAEREDTALDEVNTRFQDGREDHEDKGTTFANAAVATGQDWADAYDQCRARPANDNDPTGDDSFTAGCLTVRRAKAQQDAACNTAGGMAKNMVDMGKQKGFALREQRTQHRCSVIAGASEAQTTLDSTLKGLISGLESGRASTLDGLAQAREANLSGVDASLEARFQSLGQQERQQRQAVNDSGYIQQVAVEQMAHELAAGLVKGVSSAMESLEQSLGDLRERLLEGDAPSPDQLMEILGAAEAAMGEGVGSLLEKMEEGAANAEMSLLESGQTAASALADITGGNAALTSESEQGFTVELNELVGAATEAMAQLADSHIANAQASAATGTQSMDQLVAGYIETTAGIYTQVDSVIGTSLGELDAELTSMEEGLEAKIAAEAWRAASKEQPAWKGVAAIVLIIVIIIASIVVTVLTAGAAAAALGPILGAAVLGAVVGAVSAGLIQVINNWAAGEALTKNLVQSIVMGAVGGAIGGAIGAGANGLAQVGVNAAIRAGSSTLTRTAINVGVNLAGDMVAEGATQAFGYVAYGQKIQWQGFVTAGAMSAASTARGAGGASGRYDADASVSGMLRPTGAAGPRPRLHAPTATDAAIGLGIAAGVEGAGYLATGKFDASRFATTAAGGAGGSWAAGLSSRGRPGGGGLPDVTPPRPVAPDVNVPAAPRPATSEPSAPQPTKTATPDAAAPSAPRPAAPDVEAPPAPRSSADQSNDANSPRAQTDSGQPQRPPRGSQPSEPINRKSSADVEEMTRTPTKVGDADHESYVRKPSANDIECDICSRGCGPIKEKINEIENQIAKKPQPSADDNDLLRGLQEIKTNIKVAEDSIEGRLKDGEFMAGKSVIDLAGKVAEGFRSLGKRHKVLGDAINAPEVVRGNRESFALSGKGAGDVDVSALKLSYKLQPEQSQTVPMDRFAEVAGSLADGQQCVYVLRGPEPDRVILKVGKSQQSNAGSRFAKYRRAGEALGMDLTLEVTPLKPGMSETDASGVESALRSGLEHEGHIMPWDNTPGGFAGGHQHTGRLNRPGTGVPFEPIRGPSYKDPKTGRRLRAPAEHDWRLDASVIARDGAGDGPTAGPVRPSDEQLTDLLKQNNSDVAALRDDLKNNHGLDRSMSTIYRWLRERQSN